MSRLRFRANLLFQYLYTRAAEGRNQFLSSCPDSLKQQKVLEIFIIKGIIRPLICNVRIHIIRRWYFCDTISSIQGIIVRYPHPMIFLVLHLTKTSYDYTGPHISRQNPNYSATDPENSETFPQANLKFYVVLDWFIYTGNPLHQGPFTNYMDKTTYIHN